MRHSRFAAICFVLALAFQAPVALAQLPPRSADLAKVLSFEMPPRGDFPGGWGGSPGTIFVDDKVLHDGRRSVRIERKADSPNPFSTMTLGFSVDFAGTVIQLRAFVRTEDVSEFVGLWMREDAGQQSVAFDNMQNQNVHGTNDWKEYSITLPLRAEAEQLHVGFLLSGTGKAWVSGMQLLVDDKPIWDAPKPTTATDLDHEFDKGSRVALTELSSVQIQNLATTGKVWGFLKYNHPQITSGQHHWDYDLFRVLPAILAARDRAAANAVLLKWVTDLRPLGPCDPCAKLVESDLHLRPELDWISDQALLGADLSQRLRAIQSQRPAVTKQFYVKAMPYVGNPSFEHELSYGSVPLPDAGFQLLALYRFWNMIAYWYPYRNVLGEDWNKVLTECIPRIALAKDGEGYQREMLALIAKIHDTHANLRSAIKVRPPVGECQLPVNIRFIENRPVIVSYAGAAGAATGLQAGDIITDLDGVAVSKLVQNWLPYYAASNETTQLRDIAGSMTNGACGKATIRVRRENQAVEISADRVPVSLLNSKTRWHDVPGDTFRLLSPEVAYLKLSSVKLEDAAHYIEQAAGTKGLIIDIRNYPSAFVVFGLGNLFVEKETEFARFTVGDLSNPGAFHWGPSLSLKPEKPHYAGKIVILVDEVSVSNAEYTTMALRAGSQAKVLGSTTAGADGNVSPIPLPGGLNSAISGIGVFYPDKKPTQRIGILPDVEVKPTIAGIRAGRDEVLEAAVRQILGDAVPAAQIEKIAKP